MKINSAYRRRNGGVSNGVGISAWRKREKHAAAKTAIAQHGISWRGEKKIMALAAGVSSNESGKEKSKSGGSVKEGVI
jgi:hypothetical protein